MFDFAVSTSGDFCFSFTIGNFGLFEDIDEMPALLRRDQLAGLRCVEGPGSYCTDSLARLVQNRYGLYECRHVAFR